MSHCSPVSSTRFPQLVTAATVAAEETLLPAEESGAQVHAAVQRPDRQGLERSHCSPASRMLLPQTGAAEETEEERREEEERTTGEAAQRQRKVLHVNPVGQAFTPLSHSSAPSSFPLPQRGLAETAEEERGA